MEERTHDKCRKRLHGELNRRVDARRRLLASGQITLSQSRPLVDPRVADTMLILEVGSASVVV
jgi:hypothetical protein